MENTETETYRKLRAAEKTNICAICGANLVTVWNPKVNLHALICAHDPSHKGYRRRPTDTELVKRGELDKLKGPGAQADTEKFLEVKPGAISLAPTQDVATRQPLSLQQLVALGAFAQSVGLSAFLGHVCLYFGKPYVTIDGYHYWKNKHGSSFAVSCMPMTESERLLYMVTEGSHAFIARALTAGGDELARGIGIITLEEMSEKSRKNPENFAAPIVHNKPQRMAEKRAEWQLLRKMCPLGAEAGPPEATPRVSLPKAEISQAEIDGLWPGEPSR